MYTVVHISLQIYIAGVWPSHSVLRSVSLHASRCQNWPGRGGAGSWWFCSWLPHSTSTFSRAPSQKRLPLHEQHGSLPLFTRAKSVRAAPYMRSSEVPGMMLWEPPENLSPASSAVGTTFGPEPEPCRSGSGLQETFKERQAKGCCFCI